MSIYRCLVNGSIDASKRQELAAGLTSITVDRFGPQPGGVEVDFTEVEPGRWFTAGEPSSTTMVLGSVPAGTSQEVRTAHMDEIARFVSEATGHHLDEVMVVAADPSEPRS